jgi:short-subunit dehydrogenase
MNKLRGKNAILTGASRGLGVVIARTLAEQGVNLALAARSADALEATRGLCERAGVRAIAVPCDVTSRDDLRNLVDTAENELGPVDILVNNAAILATAQLIDLSFDEIDAIIRTNLNAPIWLTKMVLPLMLARKRGVVVSVASMAGKVGVPYESIYSTTKHGLVGFMESVRAETTHTGVRAAVVCPGFVKDAGMWAESGAGKAPFLFREVSPEKVARAVLQAINGTPEALVTSMPIRGLMALFDLAPNLKTPALEIMGVKRAWRKAAEVRSKEREHAGKK